MSKLFYAQAAIIYFFFADLGVTQNSPLRNLENRIHQGLTIGAFATRSLEGHRPFLCTSSRNLVDWMKNYR